MPVEPPFVDDSDLESWTGLNWQIQSTTVVEYYCVILSVSTPRVGLLLLLLDFVVWSEFMKLPGCHNLALTVPRADLHTPRGVRRAAVASRGLLGGVQCARTGAGTSGLARR